MQRYFRAFSALLLTFALAACGEPSCPDGLARCPLPQEDAGMPNDGSLVESDAGMFVDAGVEDAGTPDGGSTETDAGPYVHDGGFYEEPDAGNQDPDAGSYLPGTDIERAERGRGYFEHDYAGDPRLGLDLGIIPEPEFFHFAYPDGGDLGRVYNATSCTSCHGIPVSGGQGDPAKSSYLDGYRFRIDGEGVVTAYQYSLITNQGPSLPPDLRGLASLNAVSDEQIRNGCGTDDARGIHGQPLMNGGVNEGLAIQRFGREGLTQHLPQFVAVAFEAEMGIRNTGDRLGTPEDEVEISTAAVEDVTYFLTQLRGPRPLPLTAETTYGRSLFYQIGCATCHDPSRQGTDQCMHDLGPAMLDAFNPRYERPSGSWWRTARLVGVREMDFFLHDGRATSARDALGWHGGSATAVTRAFNALTLDDQTALLAYVNAR